MDQPSIVFSLLHACRTATHCTTMAVAEVPETAFSNFEDLLEAAVPEKCCPVCPTSQFQHTANSRVCRHLESHWKNGVNCSDGKPRYTFTVIRL